MTTERKFRNVERGEFVNLGVTVDESTGEVITQVEGEWIDGDEIQYPDGPVGRYSLRTDDGVITKLFGSTILDEYFQKCEIGQYVVIRLKDSVVKTGNKRNMKDYDFQVAE